MTLDRIVNKFGNQNIRILDLGCGTGGLISRLLETGYTDVRGIDISADAVDIAKQYNLPVSQLDVREGVFDLPESHYDVIVIHDVFYFLTEKEMIQVFAQIIRLLRPDGLLLMNLPAFNLFKGTHDEAVGIQQRFNTERVENFINGHAEISVQTNYWPFLLSPVIASVRISQRLISMIFAPRRAGPVKSDLSIPNAFVNQFLYMITALEAAFGLRRIWGSSIFLTIKKL